MSGRVGVTGGHGATGLDDEQLADRLGRDEELEELVHRALHAAAQSTSAEHRHTLATIAAHGFTQGPGTHVAELLLTESIVDQSPSP